LAIEGNGKGVLGIGVNVWVCAVELDGDAIWWWGRRAGLGAGDPFYGLRGPDVPVSGRGFDERGRVVDGVEGALGRDVDGGGDAGDGERVVWGR
jgi:hypothetical protein